MLSEPERLLFARLSVFAGGCTLAAAEQVCGDSPGEKILAAPDRARILDLLSQLIDRSLVLAEPGGADELRYRLLEPVRQFGAECLVQQGAGPVLRERHARWFADLVAEAAAQYHGPNETDALERLEREHAISRPRSTGFSISHHRGMRRCVLRPGCGGSGARVITGPRPAAG